MEEHFAQIVSLLASTVRLAVPLVLCALAGLFAERSGLVDIGLEGKMLAGAFAAACTAYWLQSPWLGLAVAIAVATESESVTSQRTIPSASTMSVAMTTAPRARRRSTVAAPIPDAAPVTTTRLPVKSCAVMDGSPLLWSNWFGRIVGGAGSEPAPGARYAATRPMTP